uniref:Uncharacterized protein n=1 Tax=Arundo donax TaxID=35708 RepID=A0A0A9ADL6_ARUDO
MSIRISFDTCKTTRQEKSYTIFIVSEFKFYSFKKCIPLAIACEYVCIILLYLYGGHSLACF